MLRKAHDDVGARGPRPPRSLGAWHPKRPWPLLAWLCAGIVACPVVAVAAAWLSPDLEVWSHLVATILPEITLNTLGLLAGVAVSTAILGTGLAWLTAAHDFPGRRIFHWALLLPLAVPAYVTGFVYAGLLDFTGPVQTLGRQLFGQAARLPEIRSLAGLVAVLSLVLYPYPYLLARAAFADLGAQPLEVARSLGLTPIRAFWRVAVPLARPAIAAGVALACMEAVADFGTVSLFDVRTYTVAIYRIWFGMFDRVAAGQLASLLLVFAALLVILERLARRRARYVQRHGRQVRQALGALAGWRRWGATCACATVLGLSVVLPFGVLARWAQQGAGTDRAANYLGLLRNTLVLASMAALLTLGAAGVLAYGNRLVRSHGLRWASAVAGLGYAIPGSVVAVGVLVVLTPVDHAVSDFAARLAGRDVGLVLGGTALALLFAYVVRFMAVSLSSVEAGLGRIAPSLDESARSLGAAPGRVLRAVHVPLLRGSLVTALALVFVEVMKELPATMLIRPLGWDTLAVEVWQATNESMWQRAALPALTIAAAGLLPLVVLTRLRGDEGPGSTGSLRHARQKEEEACPRGTHPASADALSLENVTKRFAGQPYAVVDGMTLHVRRGEILALLGPSGCGKTTTLRLIAGFEAPDAGRVLIDGCVVADRRTLAPPERRRVGVVFQDGALFPHLTVSQNVGFGLWRSNGASRHARVREVLGLCGLAGLEGRYPHELSGGQQQRVALARALAPGFPVIGLDEPLSGLDLPLRLALRAQLRDILRNAGATAVFVTHDREEAFEVADRVAVMRQGRLEQVGTVDEVYARPASPFVAGFVGEVSDLPGDVVAGGILTELGTLPWTTTHAAGTHVRVLLRPGQVGIARDASGAATIESRTFRGATEIVTVRLASGGEVRSQCDPATTPPPGTRVSVAIDATALIVFPVA